METALTVSNFAIWINTCKAKLSNCPLKLKLTWSNSCILCSSFVEKIWQEEKVSVTGPSFIMIEIVDILILLRIKWLE